MNKVAVATALACAAVIPIAPLAGQKTLNYTPGESMVFLDRPQDRIRSDGDNPPAPYVNGQGGVEIKIFSYQDSSGAWRGTGDATLNLNFTRRPARVMDFVLDWPVFRAPSLPTDTTLPGTFLNINRVTRIPADDNLWHETSAIFTGSGFSLQFGPRPYASVDPVPLPSTVAIKRETNAAGGTTWTVTTDPLVGLVGDEAAYRDSKDRYVGRYHMPFWLQINCDARCNELQ